MTEPPPEQTTDDTDAGWNEESAAEKAKREADWYLGERPPHHRE
jgi:hypothetical protein